MRVAIPHSHSKDEVRQRLKARSGDIAGLVPGGMAEVTVAWPDNDTMTLAIGAMGQAIDARVELGEGEVVFTLDLPPAVAGQDLLESRAISDRTFYSTKSPCETSIIAS